MAATADLTVAVDLTVAADLNAEVDLNVVVDRIAEVDPTAPVDRNVAQVPIVEVDQGVAAVLFWAQIAAALPSAVVDPSVLVDRNVAADLNATVRDAVRNAANEVQIAPSAQPDPDATSSTADHRRVQISASLFLVMDCRPAEKMVDVTAQFAHVDLENVSPPHHRPATPVERLLPEDCQEFLSDEPRAFHHWLRDEPLVVARLPNSSVRPAS